MNGWNAECIIALLAECGALALKIKSRPNTALKSDRTLVTDADHAVERLLAEKLEDEANGVYMIGEETHRMKPRGYLTRALSGKAWIIDPIDGTANFAHNRTLWGISIAFAENGVIREGGVYMPELGELMISAGGKAYYAHIPAAAPSAELLCANLREMTPPDFDFNGASVINLSQTMVKKGMFRGSNPVIAIGTCVYSCMELALGKDAVYITGCKLWDIAGALPALRALGFRGRTPSGGDLLSGKIDPAFYDLDFESGRLFAIRGQTFLALCDAVIDAVAPYCDLP